MERQGGGVSASMQVKHATMTSGTTDPTGGMVFIQARYIS